MGREKITKSVSILVSIFFLSACTTMTRSDIKINSDPNYLILPPVNVPPMPPLKPFKFDIPRDTSKIMVKNVSTCKNVPEDKRDEEFWKRCGINPPLSDSNVFLGLDEESYNNLMYDFIVLRERILLLEKIIDEINKKRKEISERNTAEKKEKNE